LIVDIGQPDDAQSEGLWAWTAWNSAVEGPTADMDPITAGPLGFVDNVAILEMPPTAKSILGDAAQLVFTIGQRE
jgi:hypothetical protein